MFQRTEKTEAMSTELKQVSMSCKGIQHTDLETSQVSSYLESA